MVEVVQSKNHTLKFSVKDQNGAAVNLTGCLVKVGIQPKSSPGSVITKLSSNAAQIVITGAVTGDFEVYLVPADTAVAGRYALEAQYTDTLGKVYPIQLATPSELIIKPTIL